MRNKLTIKLSTRVKIIRYFFRIAYTVNISGRNVAKYN